MPLNVMNVSEIPAHEGEHAGRRGADHQVRRDAMAALVEGRAGQQAALPIALKRRVAP